MWLVVIIIYGIVGFIFGVTMNMIFVSEPDLDKLDNGTRAVALIICVLFWPIVLPVVIFNTIFNKE